MMKKTGKVGGGKVARFKYRERTAGSVRKRSEQSGSDRDFLIAEDHYKIYKPGEKNNIRILPIPSSWEDAEHYALDVWVHYEVGGDKSNYACIAKMKGEECPVCAEHDRAVDAGDEEYAKKLKPKRRCLVALIDRNKEDEGPMLWAMPWTMDRDISALCVSEDGDGALPIDHPEEGYDVFFQKKGKGDRTEYFGLRVARKATPLSDDEDLAAEWLAHIEKYPLPGEVNYKDEEYITSVFGGGSGKRKEEADEETEEEADEETEEEETEEEAVEDNDDEADEETEEEADEETEEEEADEETEEEEELTHKDVQAMGLKELRTLIKSRKIDVDYRDYDTEEELADAVCEVLGLEPPAKTRPTGKKVAKKVGRK